jgi:hypothetical protein
MMAEYKLRRRAVLRPAPHLDRRHLYVVAIEVVPPLLGGEAWVARSAAAPPSTSRETQRNYIRDAGRFATFLGRSPDRATAEDLRRFQIEQREAGVPTPTMNSIVSAL